MRFAADRNLSIAFATVLMSALAACASGPEPVDAFTPSAPVLPVFAPPTSGSIYRNGTDIRLFEDLKAGRIGDILTVRLIEQTAASTTSNTSTSRSTSASIVNPTIFGRQPTWDGIPLFDGSVGGESDFEGSGASSQSNSLLGDIAVTVVDVLPNGNLVIRGEKWVNLNQGREFIELSGVIRPYDIGPDNSVLSNRVADVQIRYSGKGVLAKANRKGLLGRFIDSLFSGT